MPILVELTYEDGTTENLNIHSNWRKKVMTLQENIRN
jgi:hypothetical protein